MERNICRESGCKGACCRDIYIVDTEDVFLGCFPDAVELSRSEFEVVKSMGEGVYYIYNGTDNVVIARINGCCQFLSSEGDCSNRENRTRASRNFEIGSDECNAMRSEYGLPQV